jgi:FkbM family methyltransferase
MTPIARSYIRYAPFAAGKLALWDRLIEPYLAWESFPFVASTVFGGRMAGDTRDIIQQYIYYFGLWEPNLTQWIGSCLKPGDTFIDVGANIGYFSVLAAGLVGPSGSVVAIEASSQNFAALKANLERSRTGNVRSIHAAASDRAGVLRLYSGGVFNSGATTTLEDPELAFEGEVAALPLSELVTEAEAQNARLIKIDVEGAEWRVITGMESLFARSRPDLEIVVEVSPKHLAMLHKTPEDLLQLFARAGFHPYVLENDYTAQSYLRSGPPQRPSRLHHNIEGETDLVFSRVDAENL